ncbi:hypothetical protein BH23BAC4_BH23BAC4_04770 [soil metagenome]
MSGLAIWLLLIGASVLVGFACARHLTGRSGIFWAGAIPWSGLLAYLLIAEYLLPYSGGGASMWPIAQLVAGTAMAFSGVVSYLIVQRRARPAL